MAVRTSPIGAEWATVTVETDDDGLVVVRPLGATSAPPPHVGSAIDVAGATLIVDVTAGSVPPTAHIFDPFWSLTWLAGVYGDAVAEQVKEHGRETDTAPVEVPATYGYLSDVVVRLGAATWLHRWWPSGNADLNVDFSVELLELEIGALRWLAEAAFIEVAPIERVLRPHAETLHSSYDWNRHENRGLGQEVVEEVLTTALRGVVDVVDESVPGYQDCADLLAAIDAGDLFTTEDWRLFAELLDAHHEQLARTRGTVGAVLGPSVLDTVWTAVETSWGTADVRDIPPRWLADVEGNVEWSLERSEGRFRIVVSALAAPAIAGGVGGPPLMARAYVAGVPFLFDLAWTPGPAGGAVFHGAVVLPEHTDVTPSGLEVGVFHPSWAGGARLSGEALAAATREREEITRILTERYARLPLRLVDVERRSDPSERPTAAEIVARFRDR